MSKNFKGIKTQLYNIEYKFNEPNKDGIIDLEVLDKIEILEIKEDIIDFNVIRKLDFKNIQDSYLQVVFKSSIKCSQNMSKQDFIDAIKKHIPMISGAVFGKISLLISNITNSTPLGVIVTPPVYNVKEIEVI